MGRVVVWCLSGLCVIGALMPVSAAGQSEAPDHARLWLGLGPMFGGASGLAVDVGGSFQLTGERGPHHASLRVLMMGDAISSSNDAVLDVALLYGRNSSASFGYVAFAGGPAAVRLSGCDSAPSGECRTVGLTLAAEAGLQATVIGIGLQAFGNLNAVSSYGGLGVVMLLGWMR